MESIECSRFTLAVFMLLGSVASKTCRPSYLNHECATLSVMCFYFAMLIMEWN